LRYDEITKLRQDVHSAAADDTDHFVAHIVANRSGIHFRKEEKIDLSTAGVFNICARILQHARRFVPPIVSRLYHSKADHLARPLHYCAPVLEWL
jgi:hypothetical protein